MIKLYSRENRQEWNNVVKSFADWDVYYLFEYCESLSMHGDGEPQLIYFEYSGSRICYAVMIQDLADFPPFKNLISPNTYLDCSTPYGYGGPLVDGSINHNIMILFWNELSQMAKNNHLISQFLRFHPLLQNQKVFEENQTVVHLKKTIFIDTGSREIIFQNMDPKNRNMVRKAIRNGVSIKMDMGEDLRIFRDIYKETMDRNEADDYYYFKEPYFRYLLENLKDNLIIFYAYYNGRPISAAIFLFNEQFMHYHLSGTLTDYRHLASSNLLLIEAANWAADRGISKFHLGGGVDIDDSLLSFKKQFNRNGKIDFCIGSTVFDQDIFSKLVELRIKNDPTFDGNENFLIKYRA